MWPCEVYATFPPVSFGIMIHLSHTFHAPPWYEPRFGQEEDNNHNSPGGSSLRDLWREAHRRDATSWERCPRAWTRGARDQNRSDHRHDTRWSPFALLLSATESDGRGREPLACWTSSPLSSLSLRHVSPPIAPLRGRRGHLRRH